MNATEALRLQMDKIQRVALVIGVVAGLLSLLGAFLNRDQFLYAYLVAFLFWLGIALGSLAILMLYHLTGGGWGLIIRRFLESGARTIPLMALFFLPLLLNVHSLYTWASPSAVATDALLQHKKPYLNVSFFVIRTVGYFAIWLIWGYFLNRWSQEQDRTGGPGVLRRLRALSAPGLVLYGLTITFASVDWVMSLDPHWFSTAYGMIFVVGQVLTALAFVIGAAMLVADREPLFTVISKSRLVDLGNLMLAFVMLWAYLAFSQFLIIWAGNLPEEISWYRMRFHGAWIWLALFLLLFHFALPFLLLLLRDIKQKARTLASVAAFMIVLRLIDLFWIIEPARRPDLQIHWLDFAAPIGMGGIWIAVFIWQLKGRPLLPLNDPQLQVVMKHE